MSTHQAIIQNNKLFIDRKEHMPQECQIGKKDTEKKDIGHQTSQINFGNPHSRISRDSAMHYFCE